MGSRQAELHTEEKEVDNPDPASYQKQQKEPTRAAVGSTHNFIVADSIFQHTRPWNSLVSPDIFWQFWRNMPFLWEKGL